MKILVEFLCNSILSINHMINNKGLNLTRFRDLKWLTLHLVQTTIMERLHHHLLVLNRHNILYPLQDMNNLDMVLHQFRGHIRHSRHNHGKVLHLVLHKDRLLLNNTELTPHNNNNNSTPLSSHPHPHNNQWTALRHMDRIMARLTSLRSKIRGIQSPMKQITFNVKWKRREHLFLIQSKHRLMKHWQRKIVHIYLNRHLE
mmetsp:Transcript_24806/g.34989  ORF Transcript_24806/g.34989 Transcript_24806/m.34989 type:complete len:201 (+) Transcript_24806:1656-2258(+)